MSTLKTLLVNIKAIPLVTEMTTEADRVWEMHCGDWGLEEISEALKIPENRAAALLLEARRFRRREFPSQVNLPYPQANCACSMCTYGREFQYRKVWQRLCSW